VRVDPPEPLSVESLRVDEAENLGMLCNQDLRQGLEERQSLRAFRESSASEFSDHEGMYESFSVQEKPAESGVPVTEVVDPDRRVDQDHPDRRRGIRRNLF